MQLQKEHELLLFRVDEESIVLNKFRVATRLLEPVSGTKGCQMRIVPRCRVGDRATTTHVCMTQVIRKYLQVIWLQVVVVVQHVVMSRFRRTLQ